MSKIEIIDNTDKARCNYGLLYGYSILEITQKHIEALKNGKCIATNDGEYSTFIILKSKEGAEE